MYIQKFKSGLVRLTLKITLEGITSDQFTFNLSKPLMSHILVTRVAQLYQINHLGVILKSPFLNWTVHEDGEWRSTAWSGTQGIFAGLVDQMRVLKYFGYTVILCVVVSVLFVLYAPVFGGSQSPESLERIKHSRNFVEDYISVLQSLGMPNQ